MLKMRGLLWGLSLWACVVTRAVAAQGQQVDGTCSCTPRCEALDETQDCNKVPRDDCPCCMVCEKESKCSLDSECPDSRFCLGGMCADPCELLQPCKNTLEDGFCKATNHRPNCICNDGWIKNSAGNTCLPMEKNVTGCVYKGRLYGEGEVLYRDSCTEQCRCGTDGQFTCDKPSCQPGLFLTGQHDHDELCIELRNRPGTDDCCVVVVCANSLSQPTTLTSPAKFPALAAEATFDRVNGIRALVGSTTTTKPQKPISEDDYQLKVRDLETVLNRKFTKKQIYEDGISPKPDTDNVNLNSTTDDKMEEITESPFDEIMDKTERTTEEATELNMKDQTEHESDIATTIVPLDVDGPAVIVEHDDHGNEVQKMSVDTEVDVVTLPPNILEQESATENIVHQSLDPSQQREPRKDEGDLNSTSDKKSDINSNLEEKESVGKPSGSSLKALVVTHNSTTLFLPSSKGGELFYKDAKSSVSDWIRQEVEAGQDSTVLRGLMPSMHYTVKWSGQAGKSAKINIETKDGCEKDGSTWAVGEDWTLRCQEKCRCRPGGKLECQPRCLFSPGSIQDPLCTEKPTAEDPECCVVYDCRSPDDPEPVSSTPALDSEPKLIVTTKSHNFITLAWENFSRSAEGVYVAEYRQSPKDDSSSMSTVDSWQKTETIQGNQMPSVTIDNLHPNTIYQVRVSMIDHEQPGRIFATETISVKTEVGCMYKNESYGVGEFMVGCEERCTCYANATYHCTQPCELPYFRAGSFANDSLCSEKKADPPNDECCILAMCQSTAGEKEYEPCSNIICGQNAECVSGVAPNEGEDVGYCRCKPGFRGDAKDLKTGCVKDSTDKELTCTFKNDTYKPGDVFDDSCDYKCSCSSNGELECQPRCEFPHKNGAATEAGCQYLPDPNDECCKLRVCNSTSEAATDAARAPLLPTDGCTFGNRTFAKDEMFSDGCEQNCTCMGYGDVSCFPRCPPIKVLPGVKCHTLPDPQDTCCTITFCADKPIDVMKANVTENSMSKEANETMTEDKFWHSNGNLTENHEHEHEHTHGDVTHSHSHTHEDMFHANEHDHIHGNMTHSHTHSLGDNHTHEEHEHTHGNVTHTHPHTFGDNHTHEDDMMLIHEHEHTNDDIPHSHSHVHDKIDMTHSHGNMTHSHPHIPGDNHTHEDDMIIMHDPEHTHDGITHSHDHTHENGHTDEHTHHQNEHTHGNMTHSHPHVPGDNHTHEEHEHTHGNMTHSHPHIPGDNHTHDEIVQTPDNMTHFHPDIPGDGHTHDENEHTHGNMTHSHPHIPGDNHTHEEIEHTHGNMTHFHPHIPGDNHTHDENEHTHDNMTHSHPHIPGDGHTHDENEHTHGNMTHSHIPGDSHTHDEHEHTHGNMTHSHPHIPGDNHTHDENEHTHGNITHSHPHIPGDGLTHDENEHTHGNMTHSHPHIPGDGHTLDEHEHTHGNMHEQELSNDTHHEHVHGHDETWHSHPHPHDNENKSHQKSNELANFTKKARIDIPLHELHIVEVAAINDTAVKIRVAVSDSVIDEILSSTSQFITVRYSRDSLMWMERKISVSDISVENLNEILIVISDLEPSTPYQFRVDFEGVSSLTSKGGPLESPQDLGRIDIDTSSVCSHNGGYYKIGEEFYEGCARFCFCGQNLEVHCAAIECPETFGLDVIDPDCLEWDHEPDFVPTPPRCCGEVTCKMSAACQYEGQTFRNFDLLPTELTGCDKRCSCSYGNITCADVCPPISDQPPADLNCFPDAPIKETMSGEFCCLEWKCSQSSVAGPHGPGVLFPLPPSPTDPLLFPSHVPEPGLSEPLVMPIDANTVHFTFSIPPQYKGLPGDIFVRYIKTEDLPNSADSKSWLKEDVGTEGFISKVTWIYVMKNLEAGSDYSMQLVLQPHGIDPVTSPLFEVITQPQESTSQDTTPLPFLDVDAELHASQVSSSDAKITWRTFSEYELQYIDGFQIKYMAEDKMMPKFSQYFHRDNHMIMLRDLEPGTNYTVDLVFLEQGQTKVSNTKNITFETLRVEDPYAFDITIEQGKIDAQTATVYYSGVPEPEEKYVNIYRAIYLLENDQIDDQSFKIPKVNDEEKIFLNNLKPDTEYQVWIEAYLANGRKKKSNVISIKTKADELPKPERSEISDQNSSEAGGDDYYGALVAVAIIAAIACLGFLGLLVILLRRNNHGNATINSSRSEAAYDNPSYKVGDNTYDMEMNGLSGKNGNGAAHTDDP